MGAFVDRAINDVMAKGNDKGSAIAMLKANHTIQQNGSHLETGPAHKKESDQGGLSGVIGKHIAQRKSRKHQAHDRGNDVLRQKAGSAMVGRQGQSGSPMDDPATGGGMPSGIPRPFGR